VIAVGLAEEEGVSIRSASEAVLGHIQEVQAGTTVQPVVAMVAIKLIEAGLAKRKSSTGHCSSAGRLSMFADAPSATVR
jgi:hypothetical protein